MRPTVIIRVTATEFETSDGRIIPHIIPFDSDNVPTVEEFQRFMRCPSNPDKTFSDDPSRMIRAIKFLIKYGFKISPDVEASIRRNAQKLKRIPPGHLSNMIIGLFYETGVGKRAYLEMDRLGLLDVVREIAETVRPFRDALGNWAEKHTDIGFLFDLMDLHLPVGSALSFLTPAQKSQLREQLVRFSNGNEARDFVSYLQQPGKIVNMGRLIQTLGLKGLDIRRLTDLIRQLLLDDPALASVPQHLEKVILERMGGPHRVASRYLEAMEFPTEDALKRYLEEHPGADRSRHKVKKHEDRERKPDPDSDPRRKRLPGDVDLKKEGYRDTSHEPAFEDAFDSGKVKEWEREHHVDFPGGSTVMGTPHWWEGDKAQRYIKDTLIPSVVSKARKAIESGKKVVFLSENHVTDPEADVPENEHDEQLEVSRALHKELGGKVEQSTWDEGSSQISRIGDPKIHLDNPMGRELIRRFKGDEGLVEAGIYAMQAGQGDEEVQLGPKGKAALKHLGINPTDRDSLYRASFPEDFGDEETPVSRVTRMFNEMRDEELAVKVRKAESGGVAVIVVPGASHAYQMKPVFQGGSKKKASVGNVRQMIDTFKEEAFGDDYEIHELGKIEDLPLLLLKPRVMDPDLPNLLVIAGTHGNEPNGPNVCLEILKDPPKGANISFIPLMNPVGREKMTREDVVGKDPNRGWREGKKKGVPTPEGKILKEKRELLKELARDGALSFHEDDEVGGFYIYDFENANEPGPLARRLRSVGHRFFPMASEGKDSFGNTRKDGFILNPNDDAFEDWMHFDVGVTPIILVEMPSNKPWDLRIKSGEAMIRAFVEEIRAQKIAARYMAKWADYFTAADRVTSRYLEAQGVVEVPHHYFPVKVDPPQAKRKKHPFVGFIDFQGLKSMSRRGRETSVEEKRPTGPSGSP